MEAGGQGVQVELFLTYCNTSTYQMLSTMFVTLANAAGEGVKVQVDWQFEEGDMDMEDNGKDYEMIHSSIDFKFTELPL